MRLIDRPESMSAPEHWPGITLLAATVFLEAESEPEAGQLAVAFNPCNRSRINNWELHRSILGRDLKAYGDGLPYEIYSCWNDDYQRAAQYRLTQMPDLTWHYFYKLAVAAWWDYLKDPGNGSYFYLNAELTRQLRPAGDLPGWWATDTDPASEVVIGKHTFRRRRTLISKN